MHFWLYLHLRRLYGAAMGTQMTVAFVMDRQRSVVDVVCYCCGDLNGRVFQPVTLVTRVFDHLFIKIIGSVWFQFHYSNDKANSSNFSHLITCIIEWHLLLNWYLFRRNFGEKKCGKRDGTCFTWEIWWWGWWWGWSFTWSQILNITMIIRYKRWILCWWIVKARASFSMRCNHIIFGGILNEVMIWWQF